MNTKLAIATFGVLAMLAAPAYSLTLTNDDDTTYEVSVIVGEGDAATMQFVLGTGANKSDICDDGCTIYLNNGAEQSFEGGETVIIQDGELVIAE